MIAVDSNFNPRPRSLFLVGTGRCGSTIVLRMLAAHPDLAWFSNYNETFTTVPSLAGLSRICELDWFRESPVGRSRAFPHAAEAINVPRKMTSGQFQVNSILPESNIDKNGVERYRQFIQSVMKWQGKSRFLHKHTGFLRLAYLNALDDTGQYVHIIRDGRAVAYSLLKVGWWDGTMDSWWWGHMPTKYAIEYEESGQNPIVLAAIVWKHLMDLAAKEQSRFASERILTIKYHDFVSNPMNGIAAICDHADLDMSEKFERRLMQFNVRNADEGWRNALDSETVKILNNSLGPHLDRYGFSD